MTTATPSPSPQDPGHQVGGSPPPTFSAAQPSYSAQPGPQAAQPGYQQVPQQGQPAAAPGVGTQYTTAHNAVQMTLNSPSPYMPAQARMILAAFSGAAILLILLALFLPLVRVSAFGATASFSLSSENSKVLLFFFMIVLTGGSAALPFLGAKVPRVALFAIPGVATLVFLILGAHAIDALTSVDSDYGVYYGPGFYFLWLSALVNLLLAALGFLILLGKTGPAIPALAGVLGYGPSRPMAQPGFPPQAAAAGYPQAGAPTGGYPQGAPGYQAGAPAGGFPQGAPGYQAGAPTGGYPQGAPGYQAGAPTGGFPQGAPGYQAGAPTGGYPQTPPVAQPYTPQPSAPYQASQPEDSSRSPGA